MRAQGGLRPQRIADCGLRIADSLDSRVRTRKGATAARADRADRTRGSLAIWAVVVLAGGGGLARAAGEADANALSYRSPGGVVFRVTKEGLASIRFKDRDVAKGHWRVFNAEGWFKDGGSGKVDTKKLDRRSIAVLGPRHARVEHAGGHVRCLTDYRFDGEDVRISARVENNHAAEPMNVVGFAGLTFHFDGLPEGLMYVQHISYFQAHGLGLCHPGFWAKIGGSYATDSRLGVGTSPAATGVRRTLTLWDYADWNAGRREKVPRRRLLYFAAGPVPARGAATFDFRLRVSTNRDWKHLLAPYREHFRETFGAVKYRADHRWIATDYLNHSQQAVSATNPYGYHGQFRRIDTAKGLDAFCKTVIGALKDAGGQGVIVWGQGGDDPRGAMYRPDFDVLPPEVDANWPALAKRFREAGLKLGVCTRPRHLAVRRTWKRDQIIDINPDDAGHRAMIWRRFENMIKKGCTLFYLDSFGASFEDVKLMRFLREKMGPGVLTFAEHQCDAMLPLSGGYSETTFSLGKKPGRGPHYGLWSGLRNWEIYQFLAPGCQMTSRLYQGENEIPKGFQGPDAFFFSHRISPLLPVSSFRRLAGIKAAGARHVTPDGQWKRKAPAGSP